MIYWKNLTHISENEWFENTYLICLHWWAVKPLTGEVNNIDYLVTMKCSWCYFETYHPAQHCSRPTMHFHGNDTPQWQQPSLRDNPTSYHTQRRTRQRAQSTDPTNKRPRLQSNPGARHLTETPQRSSTSMGLKGGAIKFVKRGFLATSLLVKSQLGDGSVSASQTVLKCL